MFFFRTAVQICATESACVSTPSTLRCAPSDESCCRFISRGVCARGLLPFHTRNRSLPLPSTRCWIPTISLFRGLLFFGCGGVAIKPPHIPFSVEQLPSATGSLWIPCSCGCGEGQRRDSSWRGAIASLLYNGFRNVFRLGVFSLYWNRSRMSRSELDGGSSTVLYPCALFKGS